MNLARPAVVDYRNNGKKPKPTFSDAEMKRRQDGIRGWMKKAKVDACLFTSYHNINYLSDFLYCYFGRKYGLVITPNKATSVTAAIDGGQPVQGRRAGSIDDKQGGRCRFLLDACDMKIIRAHLHALLCVCAQRRLA